MNMASPNQLQNQTGNPNWKTRTYLMGVLLGAGMGLISAYLFNRSAEENDEGKPQEIPTGTLIGLLLSVITLIRQIAESGKPRKK
jgi:H+/Cl- antiporter ClcA